MSWRRVGWVGALFIHSLTPPPSTPIIIIQMQQSRINWVDNDAGAVYFIIRWVARPNVTIPLNASTFVAADPSTIGIQLGLSTWYGRVTIQRVTGFCSLWRAYLSFSRMSGEERSDFIFIPQCLTFCFVNVPTYCDKAEVTGWGWWCWWSNEFFLLFLE